MKAFMKRILSVVTIGVMTAATLAGCGNKGTAGASAASSDAAVTMDQGSISMGEARLYAYVMRNQYEAYYGSSIWDMEVEEGVTLGDSMKDVITDQLVQMIILSSQAEDYGCLLYTSSESGFSEKMS